MHVGIFDGVLASDGNTNLTGNKKLASLRAEFHGEDFDYIGNARPDLPLLEHAGAAMLANPHASLQTLIKSRKIHIHRHFEDRSSRRKAFLKAIRLHQWAKNVLIFVPLLLAHSLTLPLILQVFLAFFCFSLCASATYIVNDLLDIETDRRHPRKRLRPFAAGDLQVSTGVAIIVGLLTAGFVGTYFLPVAFFGWLLLYLVVTLSYSLALKRVVLVDVILLSGLYTVRMLAGGAATGTLISTWLAGFSVFLFFSLAMVKRFSELQNLRERGNEPSNGRGYLIADIEQLRSFGTASGYAAIVVFSLYISGANVTQLYHHPVRMWLIVPLLLLWISRVWLLASRGEMNEDPVVFAVTDRMSLLIGLAVVAIAIFAAL
jgi:4-hydroxybenzoate polyprenyltransferase